MRLVKLPAFSIHSNKGAGQFSLIPAYPSGQTFLSQGNQVSVMSPGCVMVEVAEFLKTRSDGVKIYNWQKKVAMKLAPGDLQELSKGLDQNQRVTLKHFRKGNGGAKTQSILNLFPGKEFGFTLQLCCRDLKPYFQITSETDAQVLRLLLLRAIPKTLGW